MPLPAPPAAAHVRSAHPGFARWLAPALLALAAAFSVLGCSGSGKNQAGAKAAGSVVERSEGFTSRPDWADANQPLRHNGSVLSFVGSVDIGGDQNLQVGYRAADSYARAELLRFLQTRVVAVLTDREGTDPARRKVEEVIEEHAEAVVDDWTIEGHYWEKRKDGDKTTLSIFSRLDVDSAMLAELLTRLGEQAPDSGLTDLSRKVDEKFVKLAEEAEKWNETGPVAPGVSVPAWATAGDSEDAGGFTFVCQGTAAEEDQATQLALARCNEKLCRLFGVKLSSSVKVKEDLDGLEASSETSETCDVRVQGRTVLNKGGECGPSGCTYWVRQSYPRAAYEEEKARLAAPTILRQEVVIQEGDKHYRDPAACEANLREYGAVQGLSAAAFRSRKAALTKAISSCDGIDGRDSGLFTSLNILLLDPLAKFGVDVGDREPAYGQFSDSAAFTLYSTSWRRSLETDRFLTQRIAKVQKFVDGAILPITLLELGREGGSTAAVEEAMGQVMRYPFVSKPASEHHFYYLHGLALGVGRRGKAPLSAKYRGYLLEQVARGSFGCRSRGQIAGDTVIAYFGYDGTLDDEEWRAAMKLAARGEPSESGSCFGVMVESLGGSNRAPRASQMAESIVSGSWAAKDEFKLFETFLNRLEASERLDYFLRYESQLSGKDAAKQALIDDVVDDAFRFDWDWVNGKPNERAAGQQACGSMGRRASEFFRTHEQAKTSRTGLCLCLRVEGLSKAQRQALVEPLFLYGDQTCAEIKPDDWPEEYYSVPAPKVIPYSYETGSVTPSRAGVLEEPIKACFEEHSIIEYDTTVVTYLTAKVVRGKFSEAAAEVTIPGELNRLTPKTKRRGYLRASELRTMKTALESCITKAANGYSLDPNLTAAKADKPLRVWFQFFGSTNGTNGYLE